MGQSRWVSYIYRYRNNVRCENAGFVKVLRISSGNKYRARIQIGMKIYKNRNCKCMVYMLYGKEQAKYLTELYFRQEEKDTIVKNLEVSWDDPAQEGITIEEYDGLVFLCDDGEVLTGMWQDYAVDIENIHFVKKSEKKEEILDNITIERKNKPEEKSDKKSLEEEGAEQKVAEEKPKAEEIKGPKKYDTVCEEILETYPKLPLFQESDITTCVKIVPQDIGKLAVGNWRLGTNSFVTHSFYQYRYLMMGKVLYKERERYVIGVPGVYGNKERYVANAFGFREFVPVKKAKVSTGSFGYWIWEISSV